MLGYSYSLTTSNNENVNITSTANTGIVYSPSSGSTGANYLVPGVYIISIYNYLFFNNTTNVSLNVTYGIATNATTTPTSSTPVGQSIINILNVINPGNFHTYPNYPTFCITVTTAGYYYSYTQVNSIASYSGTGAGGYGTRILSITRVG